MKKTIRREMTITQKEFLRLLPGAVHEMTYEISGNYIHIADDPGSILIKLEQETSRMIASLRLPVTHLTLEFQNHNDEEIRRFLQRFDLAYQKGGG